MFWFGLFTSALAFVALLLALGLTIHALATKREASFSTAQKAARVSFLFHTLALVALLVLQLQEDYSIAYVASVINPVMPLSLKLTALWGGMAGSLFFWGWVVNLCLFIALSLRAKLLDPWALLIVLLNAVFFVGLSFLLENPFSRLWELTDGTIDTALFAPAADALLYRLDVGFGLNPLLRHPGMIIHPPVLYGGFALFLIPFGVAVSQIIRADHTSELLEHTRGWILAAWVLLTAGITLGSWWSYDVLGWGGYWAWDPVETSSLLPWLSSTALLHSLLLERQRHIFRRFNLLLVLVSYVLVVFAIFITRAGLLNSVHAFGESAISIPLAGLLIALFVLSLVLLIWRWQSFPTTWEFKSAFSREAFFLYTNIILLSLVLVCLWGLLFPIFSQRVTLDIGFYERSTTPLFILLVFLMAVCPLVGWGAASLKRMGRQGALPLALTIAGAVLAYALGARSWWALLGIFIVLLGLFVLLALTFRSLQSPAARDGRLRARFGAYLVHAGLLLIALGITGVETLALHQQGVIQPGERMPMGRYGLEFANLERTWDNPEYETVTAEMILYKDDVELTRLFPGQHIYTERNQVISIPGVQHSPRGDYYAILTGFDEAVPYVTIKLSDHPLVNWMWVGSLVMIAGGILAAAGRPSRKADDPVSVAEEQPA